MDFEIYMPCQPEWFCTSFLWLFSVLLLIGLAGFIRILYKEHQKILRASRVRRRRRTHHRRRK